MFVNIPGTSSNLNPKSKAKSYHLKQDDKIH